MRANQSFIMHCAASFTSVCIVVRINHSSFTLQRYLLYSEQKRISIIHHMHYRFTHSTLTISHNHSLIIPSTISLTHTGMTATITQCSLTLLTHSHLWEWRRESVNSQQSVGRSRLAILTERDRKQPNRCRQRRRRCRLWSLSLSLSSTSLLSSPSTLPLPLSSTLSRRCARVVVAVVFVAVILFMFSLLLPLTLLRPLLLLMMVDCRWRSTLSLVVCLSKSPSKLSLYKAVVVDFVVGITVGVEVSVKLVG